MVTSASGITDLPAVLPALPKGPASSHATRTHLSTTVTKLPYPRPPKVGEDAMAFSCPCCCQTLPVGMLETSRWKKHLAEDIQPYTCVLSGYPTPEILYVTKRAWGSHLRDDHGSTDMWTCFACLDRLQFEAEADFLAHTLQEHDETISEGQFYALAAACKTTITADITSCPLCAWPALEEGEVSQMAVLDHIAEHVHAFSLRALPWAPDAAHEAEIGIQRAVTKVEPWLTKYNLTSETLTVIEGLNQTPVSSSPVPHYFDTHDYFAEDSDNSSCSTVSDGTIERELREGQSPVSRQAIVESVSDYDDGYVSRLSLWYNRQDHTRGKLSNYKFGRTIGSGKHATVFEAQSEDGKVAIKSIIKTTVKDRVEEIYQEIELLQYVKHPNIVRFVNWFETNVKYHIVTDLAKGGELFERITDQGRVSEPDAQRAVRDILASVEYLHDHGIVHRHLDVHKFCYVTRAQGSRLILISLAHADWEQIEERYIIPVEPDRSATRASAPEIMRRERSGKPADMWSIGVIAYMIIAGYSPFRSEDIHDLIEECTMGSIVFHERYWKDISDEAKDFIRWCLQPNPEDRLTIEEAKRHPWIIKSQEMSQIRSRLSRARWKCVILKVQLALQIQQLPSQQDNPGAITDETKDDPAERRYQRKPSAWTNRTLSDPDLVLEEFYNDSVRPCQKPFPTAVLTSMAAHKVLLLEYQLSRLSRDRRTLKQFLAESLEPRRPGRSIA